MKLWTFNERTVLISIKINVIVIIIRSVEVIASVRNKSRQFKRPRMFLHLVLIVPSCLQRQLVTDYEIFARGVVEERSVVHHMTVALECNQNFIQSSTGTNTINFKIHTSNNQFPMKNIKNKKNQCPNFEQTKKFVRK